MMKKTSTLAISFTLASALAVTGVNASPLAGSTDQTCTSSPVKVSSASVTTASTTTAKSTEAQLAKNKKLVLNMYKDVFNDHELNKTSLYIASNYKQHNPLAGDGRQAFVNFFGSYLKQNPNYKSEVKRIIAQNDLVVVHNHVTTGAKDRGSSVVDIFRIKNNKIVEHWDVFQPVPEKSANTNTMFPAKGTPVEVTPLSPSEVNANAKMVRTFYDALFNKHDVSVINKYIAEDYIQHNPTVPTGREPLNQFASFLQSNKSSSNKIIRVIAEGDIVVLHSWSRMDKKDRGSAVVDIFRVADGKIVEHWDTIQAVPEKSANKNTMF